MREEMRDHLRSDVEAGDHKSLIIIIPLQYYLVIIR